MPQILMALTAHYRQKLDEALFFCMTGVVAVAFAGSLWLLNAGAPEPIDLCKQACMQKPGAGKPVCKKI